jgi:hypothetical protein
MPTETSQILAAIDAEIQRLQYVRTALSGTTGGKRGPSRPKGSSTVPKRRQIFTFRRKSATCHSIREHPSEKRWRDDRDLMRFLEGLGSDEKGLCSTQSSAN